MIAPGQGVDVDMRDMPAVWHAKVLAVTAGALFLALLWAWKYFLG